MVGRLTAGDRGMPLITGRSGTQRARGRWSPMTLGASAPWSSSSPTDLRITRVFRCVAHAFKACVSFMFAGCRWWRSLAVDGGSGTRRGHAPVMRRPGARWSDAAIRPSANEAGHDPCDPGRPGLGRVHELAGAIRAMAVTCPSFKARAYPSPKPSHDALPTAAHHAWHLRALVLVTTLGPSPGAATAPCPAQTPPPNPTAAGPGDGRVQSRPSSRVHEPGTLTEAVALRSQTVLTGSGSHRYSYGGFGGGHPHFHRHADCRQPNRTCADLLIRRSMEGVRAVRRNPYPQVSVHGSGGRRRNRANLRG